MLCICTLFTVLRQVLRKGLDKVPTNIRPLSTVPSLEVKKLSNVLYLHTITVTSQVLRKVLTSTPTTSDYSLLQILSKCTVCIKFLLVLEHLYLIRRRQFPYLWIQQTIDGLRCMYMVTPYVGGGGETGNHMAPYKVQGGVVQRDILYSKIPGHFLMVAMLLQCQHL